MNDINIINIIFIIRRKIVGMAIDRTIIYRSTEIKHLPSPTFGWVMSLTPYA